MVADRVWGPVKARAHRMAILTTMIWRTGPGRVAVLVVLTIAQGLQPTAVILETGALVAVVPPAVRGGLDSPDGQRALLILALLGATFVAGAILQGIAANLSRRTDVLYAQALHDKVANATLSPRGISGLEDPEVARKLAALDQLERADNFLGVAGNLRLVVQYRTSGLAAFVIVFTFAWWAPFVLFAAWRVMVAVVARLVEHGFEIGSLMGAAGMHRSRYFRGLATESPAAKEVRVFGLAGWVVRQYADNWLTAMRKVWRGRLVDERRILYSVGAVTVAHLVVLAAISRAALDGTLDAAQLVVVVQAVIATSMFGLLGDVQWNSARALVVAGQVADLEQSLPADPAPNSHRPRREGPVHVRLDGVRFGYPGRAEPTLDGLSLEIPPRQSLAIVGENGVGKTTLIKLLCGLYEPEAGSIGLDGDRPADARSRVGVIFQDFVRYELPLRANVGFGNLATAGDDAMLDRALRDAGGGDLLEGQANGWDTVLARGYDGGRDLSGGQWQKVALARALMAIRGGAGLLILDEPTANLDVRAETELFDRFLDLTRDTTTILVSHRLASVRHAERIVVIAGGAVVEDGSHAELMLLGGTYARMFTLQAERFREAGDA